MNQPPTFDMATSRGEILIGMAHTIAHTEDNTAVNAMLMRYMDCLVKEQEETTKHILNLPGEETKH